MKKQGEKMPQTNQDAPIREATDNTIEEMSETEFRIYIVNLICEVKDGVNSEIKQKMQEVKDHFNEELETVKKGRNIQNEGINKSNCKFNGKYHHTLDHFEDRTSDNDDKIFNIENKVNNAVKMVRNHEKEIPEIMG